MFTGNLIEDLIATVERAEQSAQLDKHERPIPLISDSWFASLQDNAEYDSKLIEVA